ncbi:hypothetical protein AB0M44_08415 [Streptosporangium subroseum]|uniref:hypothetical protein n=1 Tax=Streptosporangium subroseum TaxID=106412 RepID=UPI0034157872
MNTDVGEAVKRLAPDPGPGLTPVAREMMSMIMDAEPVPVTLHRRWRPLVALPLVAAVMAAGWAIPSVLSTAPASALDIKEEGDYYVIEVKDLYTKPEVYESQLRGAGLDISLRVVPVSPSSVGGIVQNSPDGNVVPRSPGGDIRDDFVYQEKIKTIDRPGQCEKLAGCPIGVKVLKDFTGSVEVTLGREGRPGEEYQSITGLDARGEPMHCVPFHNRPVSEVRAMLEERGLVVDEFAIVDPDPAKPSQEPEVRTSVPDSMYVTGGFLSELGKASLLVADKPMPAETVKTLNEKQGCATG